LQLKYEHSNGSSAHFTFKESPIEAHDSANAIFSTLMETKRITMHDDLLNQLIDLPNFAVQAANVARVRVPELHQDLHLFRRHP
jgi:hypothetical protein